MQKWRQAEKRRVLTTRRLLQEGKNPKQIAAELDAPLKTARKYISSVKAENNEMVKCFSCGVELRRKDMRGSVAGNPLCVPCWDREYGSIHHKQEK